MTYAEKIYFEMIKLFYGIYLCWHILNNNQIEFRKKIAV